MRVGGSIRVARLTLHDLALLLAFGAAPARRPLDYPTRPVTLIVSFTPGRPERRDRAHLGSSWRRFCVSRS